MRRLIALLALLSGLAAAGAPVTAAQVSDVCDRITSSESAEAGKVQACKCRESRRNSSGKADTTKGRKSCKPVVIFIPTIQFGADRAYE
ncbi:hypothetical protein QWY75_05190 [Pontixanthobacter aestiaquae]|uniref:Uncharacterized protein n=1 Tax=Pontixanthobacter aestiaquae TaxID=1509367 RepID=A0A844Z8W5_9SPHN|nr:hypothetical protein [Pontixanthobacter aestiaquae]MDN3645600.1 hypothetical protein [Pontixanthobacter aestiaquae]MXO83403.1 hypothetical protein [Pontixanthobacter aestiaquae]